MWDGKQGERIKKSTSTKNYGVIVIFRDVDTITTFIDNKT